MTAQYAAFYRDPRWQKFRLKCLERSGWKCEECGDSRSKLNIHHAFYIAGRKPWQYHIADAEVLCDSCHKMAHELASDFDTHLCHYWEIILAHLFNLVRTKKVENSWAALYLRIVKGDKPSKRKSRRRKK